MLGESALKWRKNMAHLAPFSVDGIHGRALCSVQAHSVVDFYAGQVGVEVGIRTLGELHRPTGVIQAGSQIRQILQHSACQCTCQHVWRANRQGLKYVTFYNIPPVNALLSTYDVRTCVRRAGVPCLACPHARNTSVCVPRNAPRDQTAPAALLDVPHQAS